MVRSHQMRFERLSWHNLKRPKSALKGTLFWILLLLNSKTNEWIITRTMQNLRTCWENMQDTGLWGVQLHGPGLSYMYDLYKYVTKNNFYIIEKSLEDVWCQQDNEKLNSKSKSLQR